MVTAAGCGVSEGILARAVEGILGHRHRCQSQGRRAWEKEEGGEEEEYGEEHSHGPKR